ncbi:MAG: hypothetical protein ACFFDO_08345 [Candidatus Thorarchaeota archaeon]
MKYNSIIKNTFIYLFLTVTFLLIHELAHCITAIIFGGEFRGIWLTSFVGFGKKSNKVSTFSVYAYTNYNNSILCYRCVKIAGSLTAILSASVVNYISKKKKNITVFLTTSNVIIYEVFYWAVSPLLKFGDAYQLLQSLKITNFIAILLFSLIFFLILTWISISLTSTLIKLLDSSYGKFNTYNPEKTKKLRENLKDRAYLL